MFDETLSNLLFLNRHFKKLSKSDKSHKKAEFLMILKESHLRRPRKKYLKQALIQKIMMKKTWLMTSVMVH